MTKEEFTDLAQRFEKLAKECKDNDVAVIYCLDGTTDENAEVMLSSGAMGRTKKLCMALLHAIIHNEGVQQVFRVFIGNLEKLVEVLEKDN